MPIVDPGVIEEGIDFTSLETLFLSCTRAYAGRIAYSISSGAQWRTITYGEIERRVHDFTEYLLELGVKKNDVIALLGEAGLEWPVAFFGASFAGATVVPLDPKLTPDEVSVILTHAEAKLLFTSKNLLATGRQMRGRVKGLQKVMEFTEWEQGRILRVSEYLKPPSLEKAEPADTAVICYTSGSLGAAKGVKLAQSALVFQANRILDFSEGDRPETVFSILPLNHMFGLTCGLLGTMVLGGELCFPEMITPREIERCLTQRRVAWMLAVPQLLGLFHQGIEKKVAEKGPVRRLLFRLMLTVCSLFPVRWLQRTFFSQVHAKMGGNLRRFVSGGAPLPPHLCTFFRAVGIPVCEGYGLTETGPILSANRPRALRAGTVGPLLRGVELRIEKEDPSSLTGELLTRGPNVMQGYHRAPELDAEVFTADGWFRTGDIGYLDKDGFLHITGRAKAMIVLSNGKKVHPEEVEAALSQSEWIQDLCVLGVKKGQGEHVTAVLIPSPALLQKLGDDPVKVKAFLKEEVDARVKGLAKFKHPTSLVVRTQPFVKTSSLKVKRKVLQAELEAAQLPAAHSGRQ